MANPHSSVKLSSSQSLKARLGYFWRGVWTTAIGAALGIPMAAISYLIPVNKDMRLHRTVVLLLLLALIPVLLSAMVVGTVLGGLVGLGVGMVQAVTRVPKCSPQPEELKQRLDEIKDNQPVYHSFIQAVIRQYEVKKGIRSFTSKELIRKLKSDSTPEHKLYCVEQYLFAYDNSKSSGNKIISPIALFTLGSENIGSSTVTVLDNKGKRLDNILRERLMMCEDYPKREIRKNTRMFAYLQRKGHPCFSKMPKDILQMLGAMTNPTQDQAGNPIPAESRLTEQQALNIATETYNQSRCAL